METTIAKPAQAAPFRLVADAFYAGMYRDHFGRVPTTLAELQQRREELRHDSRMAELKALAPKLALLDQLLPDLAKHGIDLSRREPSLRKVDGVGAVIRLVPDCFSRCDNILHAALLAVGFREIERKHICGTDQVLLKHGRALHVMIDVTPAPAGATA